MNFNPILPALLAGLLHGLIANSAISQSSALLQKTTLQSIPDQTELSIADLGTSLGSSDLGNAEARHQNCLEEIQIDPEAAREKAKEWHQTSGGVLATHCLAMADRAAGFSRLAAVRLHTLAEKTGTGPDIVRARLFAQASEIWLSVHEGDAATESLEQAFALAPQAAELFLISANIHLSRRRWQNVIDDVKQAENLGLVTAIGYTARARAYKELTQFDLAADDVVRAIRIDPFNVKALVLRGELIQTGINIRTNIRKQSPDSQSDSLELAPSQTDQTNTQNQVSDTTIENNPLPNLPKTPQVALPPGEVDLTLPPFER